MPTTWPVNLLGLIFLIINVLCWIFLSWKYE